MKEIDLSNVFTPEELNNGKIAVLERKLRDVEAEACIKYLKITPSREQSLEGFQLYWLLHQKEIPAARKFHDEINKLGGAAPFHTMTEEFFKELQAREGKAGTPAPLSKTKTKPKTLEEKRAAYRTRILESEWYKQCLDTCALDEALEWHNKLNQLVLELNANNLLPSPPPIHWEWAEGTFMWKKRLIKESQYKSAAKRTL